MSHRRTPHGSSWKTHYFPEQRAWRTQMKLRLEFYRITLKQLYCCVNFISRIKGVKGIKTVASQSWTWTAPISTLTQHEHVKAQLWHKNYFEEQERTKGLHLHDPGDVTDWHRAIMPHSTILILAALRVLTGGGVVRQFKGRPVDFIYS